MSNVREILFSTDDAPTSAGTAYTSQQNTHIDQATVCNDTGSPITLTVELVSGGTVAKIYDAKSIGANSQEVLALLVNHGLAAGQSIRVTAGGAGLHLVISGRDFA